MSLFCRSGVEKKADPSSGLADRISEDASSITDPNFDVCIIGSGYGGSIAASRLSRAGKSVCLLEKGKEFRPGQYPDNFFQTSEELQVHKDGKLVAGRSNGLYEMHLNKDVNVVKGCGLGGTSLINANVALRADPRIFSSESWPHDILEEMGLTSNPDEAAENNNNESSPKVSKDTKGKAKSDQSPAPVHKAKRSDFDRWYEYAQDMLDPSPYPGAAPKVKAMKAAAALENSDFYLPPITVNFKGDNYVNKVGLPQPACNECGDCVSGCNTGAKNTLIMNYLPDAKNHGCHIFTQADVRHITKEGDKWNVWYRPLNTGREAFPNAPDLFISASVVIVSGGALGSTEILARSKKEGLSMSEAIGTRFTGNGDLLGFAFNTKFEIENKNAKGERKVGPCITSIIDQRKAEDMKLGFVVEDGTHPSAIAKMYAGILKSSRNLSEDQGFKKWINDTMDIITEGDKPFDHSLSYLVMAQDSAQGKLELHDVNDSITVNWPKAAQEPFVDNAFNFLGKITKEALDGVFIADPITENPLTPKELITVHPLGGCVMGDDDKNSVVNHKGQVWDGHGGVHKGLYVMDGSIIPSCVGVNPFYTISALCERAVHLLAKDYNWEIQKGYPVISNKKKSKAAVGVQFTETMTGWWSDQEQASFEEGVRKGKAEKCELAFTVLVDVDNIDKMMATPAHRGKITGTLHCPKLSEHDLTVADGVFNLFENDPEVPGQKLMKYTLKSQTPSGEKYLMYGYKVVKDNLCGLNAWEQTTTLFCTMYSGWDLNPKNQLGKGMIYIQVLNFARQLTTLKITNAQDRKQRLAYLAKFGRFFAGSLWDIYGPVGSTIGTVEVPRQKRPLRLPIPEIHNFVTSDGLTLRLTRYSHTEGADKGGKGPLLMIPGMGVSPRIFTLDTIQTSFGEYLYEQGFDIFLMDMRLSSDLGYAAKVKNLDEVKLDFLPAVNKVLEVTGAPTTLVLCHCVGALSFFMSMCTGELAGKVRAVASSSTGIFTIPGWMKKAQSDLHFPQLVKLFKNAIDPCIENDKFNKLIGSKLSALGLPKEEICNSPICHRVTFMYGLIWKHSNMNEATHDSVAEYFGTGSLDIFGHVAACVRATHIVNEKGDNVYMTSENAKHLRVPMFFMSGDKNAVWEPKSTEEAVDWLAKENGAELYSRYVVPEYGHSDCIYGKNAARDVYPHFADFFNKNL